MTGSSSFGPAFFSGFVATDFSGRELSPSSGQNCFCSLAATSRKAAPSFGSAFSMSAAKSKTLPLAPQPKHWNIPFSKFAENDTEFFLPLRIYLQFAKRREYHKECDPRFVATH